MRTAGVWQEFREENHIHASSAPPQVPVFDKCQSQHIDLDGPLV